MGIVLFASHVSTRPQDRDWRKRLQKMKEGKSALVALCPATTAWTRLGEEQLAADTLRKTVASAPIFGGLCLADLIGGGIVTLIAIPLATKAHALLGRAKIEMPSIQGRKLEAR